MIVEMIVEIRVQKIRINRKFKNNIKENFKDISPGL